MRRSLSLAALLFAGALTLSACTPPEQSGSGGANATGAAANGSGSSETITLGMMPKQKGIDYFNACEQGAQEAARDLGDVNLEYDGPVRDESELQSQKLDTWITRNLDAVAVACNDPNQISTSLARARDKGMTAITWDADANPEQSKRQFFVNQVDSLALSHALVDQMAEQAGEDAQVAVVSSSPTAPNQSAWLKEMETYMKSKYPQMKVVDTKYAGENQVKSEEEAGNLLKAYPELDGIWGMTSVAFPGAASAVKKAGKSGQVAVIGLGTPKAMSGFVKDGVVKTVTLWNPVDLGYLTVHVARAVAKGELKPGATSFTAGRLGEVKVDGDMVLLGKPMVFDAKTIDDYQF
ncbi:MAG: substrate-binding domain-containing protein [Armatimonadota bacterium]